MNAKRKILFRATAVALLLLIAVTMFIVGRGHTVYMDNRTIEYGGQTYSSLYKVAVFVNDKQVARLNDKERGMSTCIGQSFTMSLAITETKGSEEKTTSKTIRLPLTMDGIIINLPALLAGLPESAYLSEFVIVPVESKIEDEPIVTDEFAIPEVLGDI